MDEQPMMLKTKPRRGAFDYLLDGMHDLPPRPPERGGGGAQRIHVQIEITDRRAQPTQRSRGGVLQLLVALPSLLFGSLGHAQPSNWSSYQLGSTRYYEGTDQNGGQRDG
jgi:hypothetical protein